MTIKAAGDGAMVTAQTAPRGSGSPLHVHHHEDEWFYVLEGELTIWVDGETHVAPAGSFVLGPRARVRRSPRESSRLCQGRLQPHPASFLSIATACAPQGRSRPFEVTFRLRGRTLEAPASTSARALSAASPRTCSARSAGPARTASHDPLSWQARDGSGHLRSAGEITAMPLKRPRVAATLSCCNRHHPPARPAGPAWLHSRVGGRPS